MAKGSANCLTGCSPARNRSNIAPRVGSAIAAKTSALAASLLQTLYCLLTDRKRKGFAVSSAERIQAPNLWHGEEKMRSNIIQAPGFIRGVFNAVPYEF